MPNFGDYLTIITLLLVFQGERVACGVVTSETKIVFRSTSAMIYLFIQMSSEMWQFDNFGTIVFNTDINQNPEQRIHILLGGRICQLAPVKWLKIFHFNQQKIFNRRSRQAE
jgi:hypothetical protein